MEGLSKQPDEIKKGLGWCSRDTTLCAEACPYYGSLSNGVECASELQADALAYIQQLEREKEALLTALKCTDLECEHCKHCNSMENVCKCDCSDCELDADNCPCNECRKNSHWEWAGIKEGNQ